MSTRARVVAPFALASALVLGLSGCSVLEDWGVLNSADSVEEAPDASSEAGADATGETSTGEADAETGVVGEGLTVPTCDTLNTADMTPQLQEGWRSNLGDTTEGNVG